MLKYFYLFFTVFFISSSNCNEFHDGTFLFSDFNREYKIVRKGNQQIEYVDGNNLIVQYSVRWDTDCKYKLFDAHILKGNSPEYEVLIDTIYCQIVDVNKNTFKIACTFNGQTATTPLVTKIK